MSAEIADILLRKRLLDAQQLTIDNNVSERTLRHQANWQKELALSGQ
ncbi:MAG: hypothetical protein ABSF26_23285 [Thermoguttaceae bacterium]